uniref:Uncharacterized protein n=1 Tax=Euplotes crassus TaxID=5936 RepID=A0A7S3KAU8_EUPCR|mmetsp:Transcript_18219/g.17903  ORF Transcript_18219/g.17903 Transcript_18219/m.17903 type:complete len:123 (+) Transcript_18219:1057-1425(+)
MQSYSKTSPEQVMRVENLGSNPLTPVIQDFKHSETIPSNFLQDFCLCDLDRDTLTQLAVNAVNEQCEGLSFRKFQTCNQIGSDYPSYDQFCEDMSADWANQKNMPALNILSEQLYSNLSYNS